MTPRQRCGGCGSAALDVVLDLGATPLADRFPASPDEAERRFPLQVVLCGDCRLLQLAHVVPDSELWDDRYAFVTGASPASQAYFRDWAAWARPHARGLTVEIACNDGTLLRHIGGRKLGIEPAAQPAAAAVAAGIPVRQVLFTEAEARSVRADAGPASLVIACNVAAHAADPGDFLRGIRVLLAADGVAVVEFQDAAELVAGCLFDHVYHEHRFFFSLDTFAAVAARAGLETAGVMRTAAQGGSLRVTLRPAKGRPLLPRPEPWLADRAVYGSLQPRAGHIRSRLLRALEAGHAAGRVTAGYGATAKSCTLLNFCGIGPRDLAYVADLTPGKQGRYTPGTLIPVLPPPAVPPDTWLLLAWNYLAAVLRREHAFTGRWIVPFTGALL